MKKLLAISLALLLLVSNVGLAMNTHFCGGYAMQSEWGIAGFIELGCGMEQEVNTCGNTSPKLTKTPCCQNQYQVLQLEDTSNLSSYAIAIPTPIAILALPYCYFPIEVPKVVALESNIYANHSPPIPPQNLSLLFQQFLL